MRHVGTRSWRHVGCRVATCRMRPSCAQASKASTHVPSDRVRSTDAPCVAQVRAWMRENPRAMSLAQGIVHWSPPQRAVDKALEAVHGGWANGYGADDGLQELRDALVDKLRQQNGLVDVDVMVTAGANQAFTNVVLTLVDANDHVCLFTPYYFNHLMALQMTGGGENVQVGPSDPNTLVPDLDWLETKLREQSNQAAQAHDGNEDGAKQIKMVVLVNPCNPTGITLPLEVLERAARLCEEHGTWLVVDNTYEDFVYEDAVHRTVEGSHVLNLFSMSKAYGMMGWRIGYIAYPKARADMDLGKELLKVQDTIPICPAVVSQYAALGALEEGSTWVAQYVEGLEKNRRIVRDALMPLGEENIKGGTGAIYYFCKLPERYRNKDQDVARWLVETHGICVIPGSSCGSPGWIRVAYANLEPEACMKAAGRLQKGLEELVKDQGFIV